MVGGLDELLQAEVFGLFRKSSPDVDGELLHDCLLSDILDCDVAGEVAQKSCHFGGAPSLSFDAINEDIVAILAFFSSPSNHFLVPGPFVISVLHGIVVIPVAPLCGIFCL